jgi:hypothetical protein
MTKSLILSLTFLGIWVFHLYAQDTLSNGKALNFPFRKYGISIGNSYEFNGLRINFSDRKVQKINGLNFALWTRFKRDYNNDEIVNGISVGVLTTAKRMQPVNLFLIGAISSQSLNGLSFGGIGLGSGNINGICGSGIFLRGGNVNGVSFSGFVCYAYNAFNGLSLGGLAVGTNGKINGVAASIAGIYCEKTINGIAITPGYLKSGATKGLTFAGYGNINRVHGLSIALFNNAKELHGIQIGILNYAGNNRKGLQLLPAFNLHLAKVKD